MRRSKFVRIPVQLDRDWGLLASLLWCSQYIVHASIDFPPVVVVHVGAKGRASPFLSILLRFRTRVDQTAQTCSPISSKRKHARHWSYLLKFLVQVLPLVDSMVHAAYDGQQPRAVYLTSPQSVLCIKLYQGDCYVGNTRR